MPNPVAELATRLCISDPKPGHCSACWTAADPSIRFVDFDCMLDRGAIVEEGSMAVLDAMDELHLCESCVRQAAEVLEFRPGLHRRHLDRIREQDVEIARLQAYAASLEQAISVRGS